MNNLKGAMKKELADLEAIKDELKLQAHLGKLEAVRALERLNAALPELEAKLGARAGEALDQASRTLRAALHDANETLARITRHDSCGKPPPAAH